MQFQSMPQLLLLWMLKDEIVRCDAKSMDMQGTLRMTTSCQIVSTMWPLLPIKPRYVPIFSNLPTHFVFMKIFWKWSSNQKTQHIPLNLFGTWLGLGILLIMELIIFNCEFNLIFIRECNQCSARIRQNLQLSSLKLRSPVLWPTGIFHASQSFATTESNMPSKPMQFHFWTQKNLHQSSCLCQYIHSTLKSQSMQIFNASSTGKFTWCAPIFLITVTLPGTSSVDINDTSLLSFHYLKIHGQLGFTLQKRLSHKILYDIHYASAPSLLTQNNCTKRQYVIFFLKGPHKLTSCHLDG